MENPADSQSHKSYTNTLAFIIMNQQTRIKFFRIMLIENKFSIYESE